MVNFQRGLERLYGVLRTFVQDSWSFGVPNAVWIAKHPHDFVPAYVWSTPDDAGPTHGVPFIMLKFYTRLSCGWLIGL